MKQLIVILTGIIMGANAIASIKINPQIDCTNTLSPEHSLNINLLEEIETDNTWWEKNYKAEVFTLHGPRLSGEIMETEVKETRIATRVIAGKSFFTKLADGSIISLEDITYTGLPNVFPIGFTGTIKYLSGTEINLACKYYW